MGQQGSHQQASANAGGAAPAGQNPPPIGSTTIASINHPDRRIIKEISNKTVALRTALTTPEQSLLASKIIILPAEIRQEIFKHLAARRLPTLLDITVHSAPRAISLAIQCLLPVQLQLLRKDAEGAITQAALVSRVVNPYILIKKSGILSDFAAADLTRLEISVVFPAPMVNITSSAQYVANIAATYPHLKALHVALRQVSRSYSDGERPSAVLLQRFGWELTMAVVRAKADEKFVMVGIASARPSCARYMGVEEMREKLDRWEEGEGSVEDLACGIVQVLGEYCGRWLPVPGLSGGDE